MEVVIICILVFYFAIGALAIHFLNRKKDRPASRANWLKYVSYLLIVVGVILSSYHFGSRVLVFGSIIVVSAIEILLAVAASKTGRAIARIAGVSLFFFAAYAFVRFFVRVETFELLLVYMIVFSFDGFAQITGQLAGKKKLAASVSPEKTVAGLVGGLLMGTATGVLFAHFSNRFSTVGPMAGISFLLCVAAFLGDFGASYMKRICRLKDYSTLIPGHGGFLDRFDSFIAAGAVYQVFITFILPTHA